MALLQQLAQQANAIVGPGKGPVHGTRVHTVFKGLVDALQLPNVHTEISYLNGNIAKYGTKGSVRLDVAIGSATAPTSAFDLKTGTAVLSQARVQQIRIHLPGVSMNIPITVVR